MKLKKSFLLVYVLILSFVQVSFSQNQENKIINTFISGQAKKNLADEYRDARKTVRGDINKDGKEDLVVLYTLEGFGGGNLYRQYLAVFLGDGKTFRYATHQSVGGKDNRTIELNSIKNGTINLDTLGYAPDDASCCPSVKGKTRYVFSGGKLKETK